MPKKPRPSPKRALLPSERQVVLDMLHSPRFIDKAPAEAYANLMDEGTYLCSIRTMYRILSSTNEARERRNQAKHPKYVAPELLATGPNQVWSWDITKLKGPGKWNCFCLYVIMDIYSRYVVGWMAAGRESSTLASRLIYESARKQGIGPGHLTIHADRGSSMRTRATEPEPPNCARLAKHFKECARGSLAYPSAAKDTESSKPVAQLMSDLGITKTHSRPHVSDDNPYSESQFKTLKYCPTFPERFGSIEDARVFCQEFFDWYNNEHRHWGIGLMAPCAVHSGKAAKITAFRRTVLATAFMAHPERFVKGEPNPPAVPDAVWINKPKPDPEPTNFLQQGA